MDRSNLEEEVEDLRGRVAELEDIVEDLKDVVGERAHVTMPDGADASTLQVEADDGNQFPLGLVVSGKAGRGTVDGLQEDVDALLEGTADVVVRGHDQEDALPIEDAVATVNAGRGDDLSANKYRAALIFMKFGSSAEKWGQKLKLDSQGVRLILEEKTGKSAEAWNRNTAVRAMRQLAKLTSDVDDPSLRDPFDDEENLIYVRKGEKRTQVVADSEEWREFREEVGGA